MDLSNNNSKVSQQNVLLQEEMGRVKMHLQQLTRKNQDLEEMLLNTTQELQRERENSRGIVLTLTERLMESIETINKLEVENMRLKKDCILAVELLQCNRSVDQGKVLSTIEKLSDYVFQPEQSLDRGALQRSTNTGDASQLNHTATHKVPVVQDCTSPQHSKPGNIRKGKPEDNQNGTTYNMALLQDGVSCDYKREDEAQRLVSTSDQSPPVKKDLSKQDSKAGYVKVESPTGKVKEKQSDKPIITRKKAKHTGRREDTPLMNDANATEQEKSNNSNETSAQVEQKKPENDEVCSQDRFQTINSPQNDKLLQNNKDNQGSSCKQNEQLSTVFPTDENQQTLNENFSVVNESFSKVAASHRQNIQPSTSTIGNTPLYQESKGTVDYGGRETSENQGLLTESIPKEVVVNESENLVETERLETKVDTLGEDSRLTNTEGAVEKFEPDHIPVSAEGMSASEQSNVNQKDVEEDDAEDTPLV